MQIIKSSGIKFKGRCSCGCVASATQTEVYHLLNHLESEWFATCPECGKCITVFKVTSPDYTPAYDRANALFQSETWEIGNYAKWDREAEKFKKEIFESHPDFCLKCHTVHAPKEGCK